MNGEARARHKLKYPEFDHVTLGRAKTNPSGHSSHLVQFPEVIRIFYSIISPGSGEDLGPVKCLDFPVLTS